jgi:hypothetical protein
MGPDVVHAGGGAVMISRRERLLRHVRIRALWDALCALAVAGFLAAGIYALYALSGWSIEIAAHALSGWRPPR